MDSEEVIGLMVLGALAGAIILLFITVGLPSP